MTETALKERGARYEKAPKAWEAFAIAEAA
jgi:hypothetical protein